MNCRGLKRIIKNYVLCADADLANQSAGRSGGDELEDGHQPKTLRRAGWAVNTTLVAATFGLGLEASNVIGSLGYAIYEAAQVD